MVLSTEEAPPKDWHSPQRESPPIDDRLTPMDNTEGHYQSLKLKNSFREDVVLGSRATGALGPQYAWGSK